MLSLPLRIRTFACGSDSCTFHSMPGVHRFEDFDCWKLSNELKLAIYALIERPHVNIDRGRKGKRA